MKHTKSLPFLFALLISIASSACADCQVNYGDELRTWAEKEARRQALGLSEADYSSRLSSSRILEYEALRNSLIDLAARLDDLSNDSSKPTLDGDAALAERWSIATRQSDRLLAMFPSVRAVRDRVDALSMPATLADFKRWGGQHVGRTVILESILGIISKAEDSLNRRYSIQFRVVLDEDGRTKDARAEQGDYKQEEFATLTVIDVLAYYAANPAAYLVIVHVVYDTIKNFSTLQEDEACDRRKREQNRLANEALQKLAQTLPSEKELFELYNRLLAVTQPKFLPVQHEFDRALSILEARWRTLMSVAMAETDSAAKSLTVAKVDRLVAMHRSEPLADRAFNQVALSQFAQSLQSVQIAALDDEVRIQAECRNVQGLAAAETLVERRHEALAQLRVAEAQATLAPLAETIRALIIRLEKPVPRASTLLRPRAAIKCHLAGSPTASRESEKPRKVGRPEFRDQLKLTRFSLGVFEPRSAHGATLASVPATGSLFCTLYRSAQGYQCGNPPSGTEFSREFPVGQGSRYSAVMSGANDGGFGVDDRRTTKQFAEAKAEIDRRATELRLKSAAVGAAMPQWLSNNAGGMARLTESEEKRLAIERKRGEELIAANASLDAGVASRLLSFSREAGGASALSDLLRAANAADKSLPNLSAATIVTDGPVLPGFSHRQRVYGSLGPQDRKIVREIKKSEVSGLQADRQQLHTRITSAAARFVEKRGAQRPAAIVDALLLDAASLRYVQQGTLRSMSLTFFGADGSLVRRDRSSSQSMEQSLLVRTEAFVSEAAKVARLVEVGLRSLDSNSPVSRDRREVLVAAQRIEMKSSSSFFSGRVLDGESMLEVAKVLVDLATAWPPGISWGRDVFEAVAGMDLITGRELDEFSRSVAFLGAVTGSVGSKGVHGIDMISRGMKRAEPFLERFVGTKLEALALAAVQRVISIHAETAQFFNHASKEIAKLLREAPRDVAILRLDELHIRNVVKKGQPLLDTDAIKAGSSNSGLVYVAKAQSVGVVVRPERARLPLIAVPVALDGKVDQIKTSYWLKDLYTVEDVLKSGRYREIPRQSDLIK